MPRTVFYPYIFLQPSLCEYKHVQRNLRPRSRRLAHLDSCARAFKERHALRPYTQQHTLWPYNDSEIIHKFYQIQVINKMIEFSKFNDKSVISSIPTYFGNKESTIICYNYINLLVVLY